MARTDRVGQWWLSVAGAAFAHAAAVAIIAISTRGQAPPTAISPERSPERELEASIDVDVESPGGSPDVRAPAPAEPVRAEPPRARSERARRAASRAKSAPPAPAAPATNEARGAPATPEADTSATSSAPLAGPSTGPRVGAVRTGSAPEVAPRPMLAHGPRLIPSRDACRGLFPARASGDRGSVTISLKVSKSGAPFAPSIVEELPRGEGFGRVAESCLARLAFEPAADASGAPTESRSVVRLRFARQ